MRLVEACALVQVECASHDDNVIPLLLANNNGLVVGDC